MCFSLAASTGMVALGGVATVTTLRRGSPSAIPLTLAYFTVMEALQVAGYLTIDQCGNPVNQTTTWLSVLHIAFQPLFLNAFMLELVPADMRARWRWPAMLLAGCASGFILLQLAPLPWAESCLPGASLCGAPLCTVTGTWHLPGTCRTMGCRRRWWRSGAISGVSPPIRSRCLCCRSCTGRGVSLSFMR